MKAPKSRVCEAAVESIKRDKTIRLVQCGKPATHMEEDPFLGQVYLCDGCAQILLKQKVKR